METRIWLNTKTPTLGTVIEVKNPQTGEWENRIFIARNKSGVFCVCTESEDNYKNGFKFYISICDKWRWPL